MKDPKRMIAAQARYYTAANSIAFQQQVQNQRCFFHYLIQCEMYHRSRVSLHTLLPAMLLLLWLLFLFLFSCSFTNLSTLYDIMMMFAASSVV